MMFRESLAGQPEIPIENEKIKDTMERPDWLVEANIVITLDARPLLDSGEHPLDRVLRETRNLNSGEIYEIITPFPPAPMIEKMEAAGFNTFSEQVEGIYHSYFHKR
ncbi:MAG: hypothetical protein ABIJ04_09630 [Bacteroidota bacterium]